MTLGKLWRISHQKLLASKTLANSCLFAFFIMSQDIVKIWMVKYGKLPVIHLIHQGFQFALYSIVKCMAGSYK